MSDKIDKQMSSSEWWAALEITDDQRFRVLRDMEGQASALDSVNLGTKRILST